MKFFLIGVLSIVVFSFAGSCKWTSYLENGFMTPGSNKAWEALERAESENEYGDCDEYVTCRWFYYDGFFVPRSNAAEFISAARRFERAAGCGRRRR